MKTLGELVDKIRELEEAERDVREAELSLQHGGSLQTMSVKQELLEWKLRYLGTIRATPLE